MPRKTKVQKVTAPKTKVQKAKTPKAKAQKAATLPKEETHLIKLEKISKKFGPLQTPVLHSIDLEIAQGEFVSLTGRSGSGKSTLLYMMSGLDTPSEGVVTIDGRNLHELESEPLHEFRNKEMGFVFQFHYLLPELSGLENILMPARKSGMLEEKEPAALDLMEKFDIMHCSSKKPSEMSGGEQQRVAIARALVMQPRYFFADEPTGNLDSLNGRKVIEIIKQANRDFKTTVVMVTHERDYAAEAPRQIVLVDGRVDSDTGTLRYKTC